MQKDVLAQKTLISCKQDPSFVQARIVELSCDCAAH
jgi:hypothetical protein